MGKVAAAILAAVVSLVVLSPVASAADDNGRFKVDPQGKFKVFEPQGKF